MNPSTPEPYPISHLYRYDGPDPEAILSRLLKLNRYTGPITLHVRSGCVTVVEWSEKIKHAEKSVA